MYMLYLDHVLFPVAPEKIVMETKNSNKTYNLVDGSFVVDVGGKGLKKISFELLLPMSEYPFARYEEKFIDGTEFVDALNAIAAKNEPVWFDVYRTFPDINKTYLTNMLVVVDEISITEDAENGMDMKAKVVLTEYRNVETKFASEENIARYSERNSTLEVPYTYTVVQGDTLWIIAKRFFDDGEKYTYIANLNSIKPPYDINPGDVLRLRE
ncbi:MAG: LysM peptidoglycan-binding domain-containing protein [Clostridia bacterium]